MQKQKTSPRCCTVRGSVRYGVYPATLVEARLDPTFNEVILTFSTEQGDIVRHSPVSSRNGKHGDLIRSMFAPEFIPNTTIASGPRCVSLLQSKIGHQFVIAYSRRDSQYTAGSLSVVPLHGGAFSNVTTGQLGGAAGLSEGGAI